MAELNPKELKSQARSILDSTACDHRRLVLIYSGVTVALMLASGGLQLFLSQQISSTGGLAGLGMRSILQTVEVILSYVNMFFGPFWSAGLLSVVIGIVQDQTPQPGNLLDGFRRFGRLLSYLFLEMCIAMIVSTAVVYLSSYVFMVTPAGRTFTEALLPLVSDGVLDPASIPTDVLMEAALPLCLVFLAFFIPIYGFISYSMRMSRYLLMSNKQFRSVSALAYSLQYMKGHKLKMLKLDLSYWWYFLVMVVISCVGNLDLWLPLFGVDLPLSADAAYFMFYILYLLLQLAVYFFLRNRLEVTYALFYDSIKPEEPKANGVVLGNIFQM